MQLLLATKNKDKVREIIAKLAEFDFELISAADRDDLPEVVEDAPDLVGNAIKKAQTLYEITGIPSIADDTGLEVDALNGAPGVFSSRYSGPGATYADNVDKLLHEMRHVPEESRTARFRTVVAWVSEKGVKTVEGICHGTITKTRRGSGNFGYDPVFEVTESGRTMAEMTLEEKNRISHRGRAFQKLAELFQKEL
ncbi:RdgB/HAM1 family non-canonical purine NTP pyrophosphatase [candidate division KSB1 bacterium]|nr:RdgB/HAM1 family non-canonical purine NTP pyrophosphatase [candidate division KSB1 bacterium]